MIVERLQHFVRSLHSLTDGSPKKLVFFRIGGVSSSSRIEYRVRGKMVVLSDDVKNLSTQILRYLRGALDLEVTEDSSKPSEENMRLDIFLVIWKSLAELTEDDAEQLFWGEADIGIIKPDNYKKRIQDSIRSVFTNLLLDYYKTIPKPVQSFFVDNPERDTESFYRELLTLLIIGELECVRLQDEGAVMDKKNQGQPRKEVVREPVSPLPEVTLDSTPSSNKTEVEEDDYISSLINTDVLERRTASKHESDNVFNEAYNLASASDEIEIRESKESIYLIYESGTSKSDIEVPEQDKMLDDEDLDLMEESIRLDGEEQDAVNITSDHDTILPDDDEFNVQSFESLFDTPLEVPKTTAKEKKQKIAGLKKLLNAAQKGF